MGRSPCCDKSKVKRGPWAPEEDATLKDYIHKFGTGGNWIALPQKAGLKRCGKSCRLRWLNYLRPDIKHGGFTEEEDNIILTLYHNIGSRWSVIASSMKGRTDNDVKNYWNTKLKKKLLREPNPSPNTTKESTTATTTNNTFNIITTGPIMHLSSTITSSPFVPKIDNYNYYGIIPDFPNVNYQQTLAAQDPVLVPDPVQASLPRLMEVGTSTAITSSRDVSSFSPAKIKCELWSGNGGCHEDDWSLMGLVGYGFSSSYDALNDFGI